MSCILTGDIAVLDIGSHFISAIVGVRRSHVFGIKADVQKEYSGYQDGEWLDEDETHTVICDVLREAIEGAQSRTKKLFVGVPAEFCTVVTKKVSVSLDRQRRVIDADIDFLFAKGDDFKNDSNYKTINSSAIYYSVDGDDKMYFDVRGLEASRVDALVSYALAERRFVDFLDKTLHSCGFTEVHYVCSAWAEGLGLFEKEERDNPYVLVDIGYISSHVAVGRGEGLVDLKSFSMGGGHVSGDITEYLDVPFDVAEKARDLVDLNLNYAEGAVLIEDGEYCVTAIEACEIVRARLDMFADIIKDVLSMVKYDAPSYAPIYLTGEGIASIRGAKKYLSELLGKNIEIITPKLPGYVKPCNSAKISLLVVAETLSKFSWQEMFKRIFRR